MFYKHWKKILLALTGFFWASCDNDPSSASDEPKSSSSVEKSSSSTASSPNASSPNSSSEDTNKLSSSSSKKSSSSMEEFAAEYGVPISDEPEPIIAPKYGVLIRDSIATDSIKEPFIAAKYGIVVTQSTCERVDNKIDCDDGVTCEEAIEETMQSPECDGDICAKYGVVIVKDTTYKCDNGKVYNVAEFRSKYDILDGAVDLYGCPSDICGAPDTTLDKAKPLYGI